MTPEKIILIDGSSYIFRAFYAIQRLSTSKGFPTNAILGFVNMLARVLEVEKPTKLVMVFDTPKPTFRKQKYPDYKINRAAPPDDLVKQIPIIHRSVDCFAIKRMELEGFEADDVIGTIAKKAEKEGYLVDIITGDKDLMQLVTDKITLYDTMKERRYGPQGVVERFEVTPSQIVDFLALMGDSSDNIPGVTGIGEKTAIELIKQFGTLDGIYKNIDQVKGKRKEALLKEKDLAFLSKDLATIDCEAPIQYAWEDLGYKGPNREALQVFFEEFEFQNLLKRFDLKPAEKKFPAGKYVTVNQENQLQQVLSSLATKGIVAIDTETTSLSIHSASLVGISLSATEGEAYYIPILHCTEFGNELVEGQLPEAIVKKHLKLFLEDKKIKKIGQNAKYDLQIFRKWGIEVKGMVADTMIMSYLLNPDEPHNLDSLAFRHLGHQNITYKEVTGTGKNQITFAQVPIEKATAYSGEDADVTLRLYEKLKNELEKIEVRSLYEDIELPLVEILSDMEYRGVLIDKNLLTQFSADLLKEMGKAEKVITELAGESFNINSPKQLSKILFEKLKLRVIRKTKTGISTDESVLQELCGDHEICQWIIKYREFGKLRSTFVEGLLTQIHPVTQRVHTNYNQTITATGRLSSSNPNLQNIPAGIGSFDVRSAFICSEGSELLCADYSQIELRLLAHMSGDKELTRAFQQEEDVHSYTARLIFGGAQVTDEQRKIAKTINFGVMYGQTPFGLSQVLKIAPREAKEFIDKFFDRYSGVKTFLEELIKTARSKGYAVTLFGRRRYLAELNSQNRMQREMAERAAINAPVQGTAADLIKKAMVGVHRRLLKEQLQARMILQVHDELVLEVPTEEKSQAEKILREEMENSLKLSVPLSIHMAWGKNWRECA